MAHLQKLIAQHGSTLLEQSGHQEVPAAQELEQMDELQAWLEGFEIRLVLFSLLLFFLFLVVYLPAVAVLPHEEAALLSMAEAVRLLSIREWRGLLVSLSSLFFLGLLLSDFRRPSCLCALARKTTGCCTGGH